MVHGGGLRVEVDWLVDQERVDADAERLTVVDLLVGSIAVGGVGSG